MSLNNTTSLPAQKSPEMLFSGIATLLLGSTAIFVNAITVFIIAKKPSLRTPCFALIATEAVFNWLVAVGFVNDGVQRIGVFAGGLGTRYTRMACALMSTTKLVSGSVSVLSCAISLDRLVGITMPFKYGAFGRIFATFAIILAILVGAVNIIIAGSTLPAPVNAEITCSTFIAAFHPTYASSYKILGLVFNCALVAIYLIAFTFIYYRKKKYEKTNATSQSQAIKSQLILLPIIRTMIASNIIFGCFTDLASLVFSNYAGGQYLPRASYYIGSLKAVGTISDFFILLMMSNEFRGTLKRLVGLKVEENKVTAFSTNTRTNRGKR